MSTKRTPRRLLRKPSIEGRETLERLIRWPSLRRRWTGKKVRIWSNEHEAYWRPDGKGYTFDGLEAGIYDFEDAFNRTSHCDPSKRITYRLAESCPCTK